MGMILNNNMTVKEPNKITLSGLPNFVEFVSKKYEVMEDSAGRAIISIRPTSIKPDAEKFEIVVMGGLNKSVVLKGTYDYHEVDEYTFFIVPTTSLMGRRSTLYNLLKTISSIPYQSEMYAPEIFLREDGEPAIYYKPKNTLNVFECVVALNSFPSAFSLERYQDGYTKDHLLGRKYEADIYLKVYERLQNGDDFLGEYMTTLRKTYIGAPLWFDLNSLFSKQINYRVPGTASGWYDTGTVKIFFFSASSPSLGEEAGGGSIGAGYPEQPFYWSDSLYVLNGHGRASTPDNMEEYAYDGKQIKLLSNKPRTPYVRGQREYLNFVFFEGAENFRVSYRAFTTGGRLLGEVCANEINVAELYTVNTCVLNIDNVLDEFPNAGIIYISLMAGEKNVSDDIEYEVLPECLHSLRQFSFLNRLGGWDSVNFDTGIKEDIKPAVDTYDKTLMPSFKKGDSLETVYNVSLSQLFTVEAAPVTNDVADWLKEFATSQVILDGEGNYIIIEDFSLSVSDENFNMQKPILKYRLSETYGK